MEVDLVDGVVAIDEPGFDDTAVALLLDGFF
jgi:hypothetical protein